MRFLYSYDSVFIDYIASKRFVVCSKRSQIKYHFAWGPLVMASAVAVVGWAKPTVRPESAIGPAQWGPTSGRPDGRLRVPAKGSAHPRAAGAGGDRKARL